MAYIKRTTRTGETIEVEYFYTAGKHNSAVTRARRRKARQLSDERKAGGRK